MSFIEKIQAIVPKAVNDEHFGVAHFMRECQDLLKGGASLGTYINFNDHEQFVSETVGQALEMLDGLIEQHQEAGADPDVLDRLYYLRQQTADREKHVARIIGRSTERLIDLMKMGVAKDDSGLRLGDVSLLMSQYWGTADPQDQNPQVQTYVTPECMLRKCPKGFTDQEPLVYYTPLCRFYQRIQMSVQEMVNQIRHFEWGILTRPLNLELEAGFRQHPDWEELDRLAGVYRQTVFGWFQDIWDSEEGTPRDKEAWKQQYQALEQRVRDFMDDNLPPTEEGAISARPFFWVAVAGRIYNTAYTEAPVAEVLTPWGQKQQVAEDFHDWALWNTPMMEQALAFFDILGLSGRMEPVTFKEGPLAKLRNEMFIARVANGNVYVEDGRLAGTISDTVPNEDYVCDNGWIKVKPAHPILKWDTYVKVLEPAPVPVRADFLMDPDPEGQEGGVEES